MLALLQQLKAKHEAAAALCRKQPGGWTCRLLRQTTVLAWVRAGLTADDLALLGSLCSLLCHSSRG